MNKVIRKMGKSKRNVRDKNVITEVKNVFHGLISRLDTVERNFELEDKVTEIFKTEKQRRED